MSVSAQLDEGEPAFLLKRAAGRHRVCRKQDTPPPSGAWTLHSSPVFACFVVQAQHRFHTRRVTTPRYSCRSGTRVKDCIGAAMPRRLNLLKRRASGRGAGV